MNSIMAIHPYRVNLTWVFDDPAVGLVQEPFVAGADEMIDYMVKDIPNADTGVTLIFSANPFPGYQYEFVWQREEVGGNWYRHEQLGAEGWLCPALLKYFETAPEKIFIQAKPKS